MRAHRAEPYATAAKDKKGKPFAFILFTQPRDETVAWKSTPKEVRPVKGDRVISLWVGRAVGLDLQGKPPMAELCFCEGSD